MMHCDAPMVPSVLLHVRMLASSCCTPHPQAYLYRFNPEIFDAVVTWLQSALLAATPTGKKIIKELVKKQAGAAPGDDEPDL